MAWVTIIKNHGMAKDNHPEIIKSTRKTRKRISIVKWIQKNYSDLNVEGFLKEFYVNKLLSPLELQKLTGIGSLRGWQHLVERHGLNRNKFQAQQIKWKTGRGEEQRKKLRSRASGVKWFNISNKLRYKILLKYKSTCQLCGAKAPEARVEVDHIIPQAKGGKSTEDNLWVLCGTCNSGKKDRDLINNS